MISVRMFLGRGKVDARLGGGRPGWVGLGAGRSSLAEAVIIALGSTEADDGVNYRGRQHRSEAVDDGHDHRVHLAVVAVGESNVIIVAHPDVLGTMLCPQRRVRAWAAPPPGPGPAQGLSPAQKQARDGTFGDMGRGGALPKWH